MIGTLYILYRVIVALLALIVIRNILKEKSLAYAINLGIICVPLVLRALMIK